MSSVRLDVLNEALMCGDKALNGRFETGSETEREWQERTTAK